MSEPTQYFNAQPTAAERRRTIGFTAYGHEVELTTAGGVFAADGLDRGTAVLLRSVPPPTGVVRVLDLGCGYGSIALALAIANPQLRVDAVDVNERALALCRENAATLGVAKRVRVLTPDQVADGTAYDQIWSNPPIRIGKTALHELLARWLPRLTSGGVAHLVVGRHLGADTLQRWLVEIGFSVTRTASAKGFRVLEVRPGAV